MIPSPNRPAPPRLVPLDQAARYLLHRSRWGRYIWHDGDEICEVLRVLQDAFHLGTIRCYGRIRPMAISQESVMRSVPYDHWKGATLDPTSFIGEGSYSTRTLAATGLLTFYDLHVDMEEIEWLHPPRCLLCERAYTLTYHTIILLCDGTAYLYNRARRIVKWLKQRAKR